MRGEKRIGRIDRRKSRRNGQDRSRKKKGERKVGRMDRIRAEREKRVEK